MFPKHDEPIIIMGIYGYLS